MRNNEIVQKLWNLCDVLRDDGINYSDYVTELVQLLFIKMEFESTTSGVLRAHRLPEGCRWADLEQRTGAERLDHYKTTLSALAQSDDKQIAAIYAEAETRLKEPRHLDQLVRGLDNIDWFSAKQDGLGDIYEGLLEKNAGESKSGAGQYFTPRPLIDSIVRLVQPKPGEVLQDPAAGTAGFLIAADRYVRAQTEDLSSLTKQQRRFQQTKAYVGMELVSRTRRLALMNCLLHGMEGDHEGAVHLGNTLGPEGEELPRADVILSNPPFGTARGGGGPTRGDLPFKTGNKQLSFLQHIYLNLKDNGRAAVVLPDNVLFEGGVCVDIRRDLMDTCSLHTIVRLPTGIFYAQGIKTSALFFCKPRRGSSTPTNKVWVYDLRANMPKFGKRTPLTDAHFVELETAFGIDPYGRSERTDEGAEGRFRSFDRDWIRARGDDLNISWLKDSDEEADASDPSSIALSLENELSKALSEVRTILTALGSEK